MKRISNFLFLLAVLLVIVPLPVWAGSGQGWLHPWEFRNEVTIHNTSGSALTNFQVKVTLGSSFDFNKAKGDGSDLRMTSDNGTTEIPLWVENWNPSGQTADVWIRVPWVPTTGTTVFLYYGNADVKSVSNGDATFLFFDDFNSLDLGRGYWTLGSAQTELVQDQTWEGSAPHSLSVQKLNMGGHTYWGWYGTQEGCTGVGLAFSEDLVTWTKYTGNPLFTNGRWPRVVRVGSTFYMAYTLNYCATPEIDLATSTDGINWTNIEQLVPPSYLGNPKNQNPDLWLDPNDGKFYLYWYNGNDTNEFNIMSRSAASPTGLNSNSSEVKVLTEDSTLAAPDMMYHDGTYFLATEALDAGGLWNVWVFSSTEGPTSGFTLMAGNPVLNDGSACMFQTVFGITLHEYYCKLTGSTWTLEHRQTDLNSTRSKVPQIDPAKWTPSGGLWTPVKDTQQNGAGGLVAQGSTSGTQILQSKFTGTDYVLEAYGKQVQGRVWGLGFRVSNASNFYSINLYDDLNSTQNLYSYSWFNNNATTLGSAAVGTVNPNTWYKLTVRVQGSSFDIYKDDVFQMHTSDGSFASGGIALYGEQNTVAHFNNILVRKFAATDPTASLGAGQTDPEKDNHSHDFDHHDGHHDDHYDDRRDGNRDDYKDGRDK